MSREPNEPLDELQHITDGHWLGLSHRQLESMITQQQAFWAQEEALKHFIHRKPGAGPATGAQCPKTSSLRLQIDRNNYATQVNILPQALGSAAKVWMYTVSLNVTA